jgi:hypothetical protein
MALGTTVDDFVERVRRDSLLASRGPVYTLGSNYTAGGTQLTLTEQITHIGYGSTLSIDYEMFYVTNTVTSTGLVDVIPAYFGTTGADHTEGTVVEVDARFPRAVLLDSLEHEIRSWGKELWRAEPVDLDIDVNHRTYDLAGISGDVYFLLDFRQAPSGSSTSFWNWSWTADGLPHLSARLLRRTDLADFPSGFAVQLLKRPTHSSAGRVIIAQPLDLDPFDDSTDLVNDVGLRHEWLDIAEFGVKYRVLNSALIGRSDWRTGGMARDAEAVSALDTVRAVSHFAELRQMRLAKSGVDLRAEYPYREN